MAKRQILIYLDNLTPGAEVSWLVTDQQLRPGPVFHGDLKTAANHASGCRVVVMVPGQEILLTTADLPNLNRQRLNRAVPFALEETMAADVDDLHFATGVRAADGRLCVAACDREQLEYWITVLRDANINADVLIPAVLGVPAEAGRWRVVFESEQQDENSLVMLRQGSGGISFERKNLDALLRLAIEQCAEANRPQSIEFVQLNSKLSSDYLLENPSVNADDETVIRQTGNHDQSQRLEPTLQTTQKSSHSASLSDYVQNNNMTLPLSNRKNLPQQVGSQDLSYRDIEPVGSFMDHHANSALDAATAYADDDNAAEGATASNYQLRLNQQMEAVISPAIQSLCDEHHISLEYSSGDFTTLTYVAAQALQLYEVNLLQGEFSRKEQLERVLRPWIPAAAVAAVWMIVQAGLFASHYIELSNKEQQLMQRMDQVFADAFPEAKKTKFHLREMQNRVASLKKEGSETVGGFIPLLYQAGNVLQESNEANITAMRFKNDKIDITMEISDLQALDKLKENLINKAQLKVEILSASSRDGKVSSRIQVEPQGS